MRPILLGAMALAFSGCFASYGNFLKLTQDEQARFERCQMPVRGIRCPGLTSEFQVSMCVNTARSEYADGASLEDRKRWLLENGCPASMVDPDRYVGAEAPRQVVVVAGAQQANAPQQAARPPSLPGRKDGYDPLTIHQLTSSYDEFKDRTRTAASTPLGAGLTAYLFAMSEGRSASAHVTTIVLGVSEPSDKAQHADNPSLIFLVDGRRVVGRNVSRHEGVTEGRVLETISMPLTVQELRMLVGASVVRGQLDTTEFAFSPQAQADVRAFAERIGAVAPAPTRDGSEYWLPEGRSAAYRPVPSAATAKPSAEGAPPAPAPIPLHRW